MNDLPRIVRNLALALTMVFVARPMLAQEKKDPTPAAGKADGKNGVAEKAEKNGDPAKNDKKEEAAKPKLLPPVASEIYGGPAGAPLTLNELIDLGMQRQPALAAARASLGAAASGQRAVNNLGLFGLFARDLPIRKEQSCYGVTIARAGLEQAEWETRYAVTRNFYSVQYARAQAGLLQDILKKLSGARKKVVAKLENADADTKVTKTDLQLLDLNTNYLKTKTADAENGERRAVAALREAIGVNPDFPLAVAFDRLPAPQPGLNKEELISQALAHRPEIQQAFAANRVTELEIIAQYQQIFKLQTKTFAAASDIHAKPIPQGVSNTDYRPGAIGIEMPVFLVGKRCDRTDRATQLNERSVAVVEKTNNLIALEVEALFLKYLDGIERTKNLDPVVKEADDLFKKIDERLQNGETGSAEYMNVLGFAERVRAEYNEALYMHALGLAGLERATAGSFRMTR